MDAFWVVVVIGGEVMLGSVAAQKVDVDNFNNLVFTNTGKTEPVRVINASAWVEVGKHPAKPAAHFEVKP